MLGLQRTAVEPGRPHWTPAIRERFLSESAGRSARAVAVVTLLTSLLLLAWAPGDFEYFPEHAVRFTWYRIATVVAAVALAVCAVKAQRARVKLLAMWLWFVPWGVQSAAMIPPTPDDLLSHTFVIVIAQLGSLGIMLWSWRWCLTMSLALVGICEVALLQVPEAGYDTFAAHGYLLTGTAFATLFTAVKFQGAREQFEQRLRLEDEKQRSETFLRQVGSMRQERLTWLENLARFLRHELSNQIVAVSTSIDLAKSDGSSFGSQTYLERAQRSLGRMRGLVSTATEATSLEAALAVEEMEPVDLSGVVMDRVTAFQELHPSRHFTLELRPRLSIDGNEARVAQLLDKLLSNAVEHSPPEAEVRVRLRRLDADWLEFSVENEGDALPKDKSRLFEAFVSTQKSADNLGLGLFVAQSIVVNHGGQIWAEDLSQGCGARFVARLPRVRAVGRGEESQEAQPGLGELARPDEDQPPQ